MMISLQCNAKDLKDYEKFGSNNISDISRLTVEIKVSYQFKIFKCLKFYKCVNLKTFL